VGWSQCRQAVDQAQSQTRRQGLQRGLGGDGKSHGKHGGGSHGKLKNGGKCGHLFGKFRKITEKNIGNNMEKYGHIGKLNSMENYGHIGILNVLLELVVPALIPGACHLNSPEYLDLNLNN